LGKKNSNPVEEEVAAAPKEKVLATKKKDDWVQSLYSKKKSLIHSNFLNLSLLSLVFFLVLKFIITTRNSKIIFPKYDVYSVGWKFMLRMSILHHSKVNH
jgi:hypothetical protein